jgi:hypothetical protein
MGGKASHRGGVSLNRSSTLAQAGWQLLKSGFQNSPAGKNAHIRVSKNVLPLEAQKPLVGAD